MKRVLMMSFSINEWGGTFHLGFYRLHFDVFIFFLLFKKN
jgi:hypothetical protein